jgi:hypothetical protein
MIKFLLLKKTLSMHEQFFTLKKINLDQINDLVFYYNKCCFLLL